MTVKLCRHCRSRRIRMRGFRYNKTGSVQKYNCKACGGWSSDRTVKTRQDRVRGSLNR